MAMEELVIAGLCLLVLAAGMVTGVWWLLSGRPGARDACPDDALADARDAVLQLLDDPASARFRNLRYHPVSKMAYGEVNARNLAGVYTGFRGFSVSGNGEAQVDAAGAAGARGPVHPALHLSGN